MSLRFASLVLCAIAPFSSAEESKPDEVDKSIPQILQRIADGAGAGMHPYLGTGRINELREALDQLDPVKDLEARWQLMLELGENEIRVGRIEEAIATLEDTLELVIRSGAARRYVNKVRYNLGIAHLRSAELANCCQRFTPDSCILPIRGDGIHTDTSGSKAAIEQFESLLANSDKDSYPQLRARWLLNIAAMTLGIYPDGVDEEHRIGPEAFESSEDFPHFEQVGTPMGIGAVDLSGGLVVDDFDGDGWLDVLTSTSDTGGGMHLYLNDKQGGFVEQSAGLAGQLGGLNLVQADYDNDGDVDVFVLRGAWWDQWGLHPNSLLRNDGKGKFEDVTRAAGLAEPFLPTQTAAWGDYDNDGDLDLYVGNETASSQLFRNEGDGTFIDVTQAAGVSNDRYAKGVVWGDYDGDRAPDLYVSNLGGHNRLYHNNGDGTFVDIAAQQGVELPISGFPCWFFDYDNDGRLDLYAGAFGGPEVKLGVAEVACGYLGRPHRGELDRLYRNTRRGFRSVEKEMGLDLFTLPMGANFGDLDNDGWLDFYLGTGYPAIEGLMPNVMYRNMKGQGFADVSAAGGFGHLQKGHAIAFADFDRDGDQDVFEQMGGAFPGDVFSNALYLNPGFDNRWIKVRAIGTQSNRSAIGARVHATFVDGEEERHVYRTIGSGGSFGANPMLVEIGLGRAEVVKALEIYWPVSDQTQRFEQVAVGRRYLVTEGTDELVEE